MEITIDKLSYGGAGVGRVDGKVVFVDGGVPGDKLKIKLVEEKESYSRAEIEDFIVRSEKRTEPECKFFTNCGGCNWQDVNYKTQLIEKQQIVSDSLQRIGKLAEYELDDIAVSPKEYGYRNRVLLTVFKENDEYRIGYFEEGSDQNISIDRCVIASDEINGVISVLIKYFENNKTLIIPFDKIYLLSSYKKISISFLQSEKSHKSESQEIVQNIIEYIEKNLAGISLDHRLEFEFMGYQFTSSPYLFNQANYEINKEIIHTVAGWIEPIKKNSLLDLYCGIGNFSIAFSKNFEKITGVDSSGESIKLAKRNADVNDLVNINFIHDKCRTYIEKLKEAPDFLLADPPRNGMKELLAHINRIKPKNIIYISCNPATLSRDLKVLTESNYKINKIKPFDMFPQTYHVEIAAWLELI